MMKHQAKIEMNQTKDIHKELNVIAVDDESFNLELIKAISAEIYPYMLTFTDPLKALAHASANHVDIMLVDYMMPNMNGIELMKRVHAIDSQILVVMITALSEDNKIKLEALNEGAIDFLAKPIMTAEYRARMNNVGKLKLSQRILADFNKQLKEEVEKATEDLIQREQEALKVLSNAAEYKDPETASHVARVAHYSKLIAEKSGLSKEDQETVFYASPLHDIGKVGISDAILLKTGKLNESEWKTMQEHCSIGWKILESSENHFLSAGSIIASTHHEKYDGTGYPNQLKGEEIHIFGRITAIADVFDALTSERPYKAAWSFEDAAQYLREQNGLHFDPILCDIFLDNLEQVREIYIRFSNI